MTDGGQDVEKATSVLLKISGFGFLIKINGKRTLLPQQEVLLIQPQQTRIVGTISSVITTI